MKKIIAIILVLISVNSYSQILYLNYAAKKDTALWQTNGANIINKNTGNTGIGIAPLNKLHIGAASVANTGGIRLPITSTSAAQTGQPIGVNASGDIVRLAAATFDATVSFSTVTPTTGGVVFTPNTPANTTVLYVSAVDGSQWTYNGTTYVTQPASADWKTAGNAGSVQATNFVGTTDNVGLSFRTNNVIRQTIDNTGNVGIGTTTPAAKLDVNGSAWFGVQKGVSDAALSIGLNILNVTSPTKITTSAITTPEPALRLFRAGTASVKYSPSADFSIGTYETGIQALTKLNINLGNNNSSTPDVNVMTLQGNGNVGIGTTTPIYKLDVNSNVAGTGFGASNAGYAVYRFGNSGSVFHGNKLIFTGFGGSTKLGNINTFETASGSNMMSLGSGANENALNIASSGNVGIGTTAPTTAKLVIAGLSSQQGIDLSTADQYANMRVIQNTNSTIDKDIYLGFASGAGSKLRLFSNNIETLVTSNGNVGIGTTVPVSKLDIAGFDNDNEPILRLRSGNSAGLSNNGAQIAFSWNNTNQYNHFINTRHFGGANSNNAIDFYVSDGTANNTVTSGSVHTMSLVSGNVGIGTTAPTQKLHVIGNILASGTITPSDKRLKSNIKDVVYGVDALLKLKAVSYTKKFSLAKTEKGEVKEFGFIAQDLQKVIPELVTENGTDKILAVNYTSLIPILVKSIQELKAEIEALKAKIK